MHPTQSPATNNEPKTQNQNTESQGPCSCSRSTPQAVNAPCYPAPKTMQGPRWRSQKWKLQGHQISTSRSQTRFVRWRRVGLHYKPRPAVSASCFRCTDSTPFLRSPKFAWSNLCTNNHPTNKVASDAVDVSGWSVGRGDRTFTLPAGWLLLGLQLARLLVCLRLESAASG